MSGGRILVTGATGFVGSSLVPWLTARGRKVRVALRNPADLPAGVESAVIGDIADPRNLHDALKDVDAIVHCAGVAHATETIPDAVYVRINRDATLMLARAAAKAGVRRFLFLSSIRAQTGPVAANPLTEATPPQPTDAYGRTKLEAEAGLAAIAAEHPGFDWAALRPVLVYGPGVKGNMRALLRLARSPWPVPLGGLDARRSILAIDNLCAAIDTLIDAPGPLGRPFIVADPEALTAGDMVAAMRKGLGRPALLLPVPAGLLRLAARLAGREDAAGRLTGGLEARPEALMALGWRPRVEARSGLALLAASPEA